MDVAIAVTWEGGLVTRHMIRDLPDLRVEELQELFEKDLASYVDPDELPTSPGGWALRWVSVELANS